MMMYPSLYRLGQFNTGPMPGPMRGGPASPTAPMNPMPVHPAWGNQPPIWGGMQAPMMPAQPPIFGGPMPVRGGPMFPMGQNPYGSLNGLGTRATSGIRYPAQPMY